VEKTTDRETEKNKRRTVLTISDTFCYFHEAHRECADDAH